MVHSGLIVAIAALVTIMLRFLPFLVFGRSKETPAFLTYLSGVLPYAIMAMLVVYCLKNVDLFSGSHGLPEAISVVSVIGLHVWKRNTLLSIAAGTVLYMVLIQIVF